MEILLFSILLCNWNNTAMQYSLCEIDGICTVAYALKSNHTTTTISNFILLDMVVVTVYD